MKAFNTPAIEVLKMEVADIITTSTGDVGGNENDLVDEWD